MELSLTHSLEAFLAGAISATQPTYHVSYVDKYFNSGQEISGSSAGSLNSTTDVTICAAPTADFVSRKITSLIIYNADNAAVTVTIQRDIAGTEIPLIKAVLASGYSLVYNGSGFSVSPYEASASDSKATSNSVVISTNLSTGDSKAASNSTLVSGNTSRATSNSVIASSNLATGDSKATSLSVIASGNTSRATSNSVIGSTTLSTGDSKAASIVVVQSTNLSTALSAAASAAAA